MSLSSLADEVRAIPGGENLEMCYSCGTCTSKCMIQQKVDPEYNPRRLLRLIAMDLREEAFTSTTTWLCSACDLCYPACPQKIHISGVITAAKKVAVRNGQKSPLPTAAVNQQSCVACGLCRDACPYEAITLQTRKIPWRGQIPVAVVDPGLCMACGVCGTVCRSNSIGLPAAFNDQEVVDLIWDQLQPQKAGF